MVKDLILQTVNELPDDITIEDFFEALYLRLKVENALENIKDGNIITSKELKEEMKKWQ